MMNKASLSRTVGGSKPLLVMSPYWQPVIDCLEQEGQLNSTRREWRSPAMEIVTLVRDVEQAVEYLKKNRKRVYSKRTSRRSGRQAVPHKRRRRLCLP